MLAVLLVAMLAGPARADQVNWNQRGNDAVRRELCKVQLAKLKA
jgi:hypothetical protein